LAKVWIEPYTRKGVKKGEGKGRERIPGTVKVWEYVKPAVAVGAPLYKGATSSVHPGPLTTLCCRVPAHTHLCGRRGEERVGEKKGEKEKEGVE